VRCATVVALVLALVPLARDVAYAATSEVPPTIDASGTSDVTAQLQRFVDSVPDGATVVFPHGATYRIDGTLEFRDRWRLTVEGNGASLEAGARGGPNRAHVRLTDGGDWTIRNLTVRGANRADGHFDPNYQWQHGFDMRGVQGARLDHVTIEDVLGDDIYIGLSTTRPRWSQDISIIDSTGMGSGRMAIAITAGRRITVDGGLWSKPGLSTFDVEPNGRPGGADRIVIENATLGPGARDRALDITGDGPVSNVTMRNNFLAGRPLHVRVDQGQERPRNIAIEGNTSRVTFSGPPPAAMIFRNTDGVTVTGNTQLLQPGRNLAMVATEACTRVDTPGQYPYRELQPLSPRIWYVIAGVGAVLLLVLLHRRIR
jgi:hypothetical protein